jgi:hypothetical protein
MKQQEWRIIAPQPPAVNREQYAPRDISLWVLVKEIIKQLFFDFKDMRIPPVMHSQQQEKGRERAYPEQEKRMRRERINRIR